MSKLLEKRVRIVDSKTPTGIRSVAISSRLAELLSNHYARSAYQTEHDYVFCHPDKGSPWNIKTFRTTLKGACEKAGIDRRVQIRDLRATSITSSVLANENEFKLQARAGHKNISTTQRYVRLAGKVFHEEAEALDAAMFGQREQSEGEQREAVSARVHALPRAEDGSAA